MSSLAYADSSNAEFARFATPVSHFPPKTARSSSAPRKIELAAGENFLTPNRSNVLIAAVSGSSECRLSNSETHTTGSFSRGALCMVAQNRGMTIVADRAFQAIIINLDDARNQFGFASDSEDYSKLDGQVFRDPLIFQIILTMHEEQFVDDLIYQSLRQSASAILRAALIVKNERTEKGLTTPSRCSKPRLDRTIRWIDDNLAEKITINDLIEVAGVSEWHFLQEFKATYNCPPHSYIMECRLAKAQELLVQPKIRLSFIAYECGFSSQSHLTTAFKQRFGITPGQFRVEKSTAFALEH